MLLESSNTEGRERTMLLIIKDYLECIYYIAFIILTVIITRTGILNYEDQKKKAAQVLVRVNYNYDRKAPAPDRKLPVTIDLYNAGDEPQRDLLLIFSSSFYHLDRSGFHDPSPKNKRNTVPRRKRTPISWDRDIVCYGIKEKIPFIAPHETFKYVIGWNDGRIIEWNQAGKVKARTTVQPYIAQSDDYEYSWENKNVLHVICLRMESAGEST